jgi:fatty-acyl-CoA synthase
MLTDELLVLTHLSMWEMLRRSAQLYCDRPAVAMGNTTWSYTELADRSLRAAAALELLGVTRGTRVAFMLHACPEWAALHYGLARLGAVAVPLNYVFEKEELRYVLERAEPEIVVSISGFRGIDFADKLRSIDDGLVDGSVEVPSLHSIRRVFVADIDDDERLVDSAATAAVFGEESVAPLSSLGPADGADPAYIVFTSGSTAFPKAALCPHRAFLGAGAGFARALCMTPDDRFLAMLPTFHAGGPTCDLVAPHVAGACAQLIGGFDASRALREVQRTRCTVSVGFDTMFTKMMGAPEFATTDRSSLRRSTVGATPAYIATVSEAWGLDLAASVYGSTESGALMAIVPPWVEDPVLRREMNGHPLPGMEVVIIDPETGVRCASGTRGEICFRGWSRLIEYVGQPDETAAAIDSEGFFHSGDYGWLDDDGALYFRGRYKMMIKTGGENVAEREVEIFLENELAPVEFAQVVGIPDDTWGEAVVAFVQLSADVDSKTLRTMSKGKIARYKIPKLFFPMRSDEWPTLANGRPDKETLRRLARERTA